MPVAYVRSWKGVPTLFIDGEPTAPLIHTIAVTNPPEKSYLADIGTGNVHLYRFYYRLMSEGWPRPGQQPRYPSLDKAMANIRDVDPNAWILPHVVVDPPLWWETEHPDELTIYADEVGDREALDRFCNLQYIDKIEDRLYIKKERQSFASEVWRKEATDVLEGFLDHVAKGPQGDRVVGYQVGAGWGTEWIYWGTFDNRFGDYSPHTAVAFRMWLRDQYNNDVTSLRHNWKDAEVDFHSAQIPSKEQRLQTDLYGFRDPSLSKQVIDYYRFSSQFMADRLLYFAEFIKQRTRQMKIVGAFYGYLSYGGMFPYVLQHSGHRALERILHSPHIDFLASPIAYNDRGVGGEGAKSLH